MAGPDDDDSTAPDTLGEGDPAAFDASAPEADVGEFDGPDEVEDLPTVTCSRCGDEWDLAFELDRLRAGNRAVEQFALDHERHTGHYPDDVSPWVVACRQCPGGERFLAEPPARRWARTHARHTRHAVDLGHAEGGEGGGLTDEATETIEPESI